MVGLVAVGCASLRWDEISCAKLGSAKVVSGKVGSAMLGILCNMVRLAGVR